MLESIPIEDEIIVYIEKNFRKGLYHMTRNIEIVEIKKELRLLNREYGLTQRYE